MTARSVLHSSVMALLFAGLLAGCSEGPAAPSSEDNLSVPEVSVVELQPAPLAVIRELPGRIAPTRIAEVRARVSGIVVNRNFEQGSDVKAGDVLYELDARPFEIDVDAAEAAFRKATAVLNQEKKNAKRMEMLAPSGAAAQSQLDIAIANVGQAEADVAARKADIARAKLNLEYASIRAPISGRVGRALVTEGALVGQNYADACGHDSAARSDLCGLHAIGRRAQRTAARIRYRRVAKKDTTRAGAAHSRRRPALSARRQAVVLRFHGRSGHRPGDAARRISQSRI